MFSKISKFLRLSWDDRTIIIEAFLIAGIMRFAILFVPFNRLARRIGNLNEESTENVSDEAKKTVGKIGWAVSTISRHTPWETKCLVKALTTQTMLAKRNLSSTLYLGVAKDMDKKLLAHAWLRCGTDVVVGGDVRDRFTVVARFANNVENEV